MAYARRSATSSVYVIGTEAGFECLDCAFLCAVPWDHITATAGDMVTHLLMHRTAGDLVPEDAIARLREDAEESADA